MATCGLLCIDEGTSSTRASVVRADGTVGEIFSRPVTTRSADGSRIEQDAAEIWAQTRAVARAAVAWAAGNGVELTAVTVCTQRATAIVWDRATGEPLAPAVSWQDRRYADELAAFAGDWDDYLMTRTGRPVGVRCAFLWLARTIEQIPAVAQAHRSGRLLFGTVDSWLVWKLTGAAVHAISTTNAVALGGYDLRRGDWDDAWIAAVGCPRELVPPIFDDDGDFGVTDEQAVGARLPIAAVMGDQHSALIAFGATDTGAATCVHGTGTFGGAVIGPRPDTAPRHTDNVLTLVGWRSRGVSTFSLEAYAATTGAALRWLCEDLGFFSAPEQIARLARDESLQRDLWFVPALAGTRTPTERPDASGVLAGLALSSTRAQVARAVLDGIAHTVCGLFDGLHGVLARPIHSVRTGGGLAASDVLMSAQADLLGVPVERVSDFSTASLRGAAYLGGVRLGLWESMGGIVAAQRPGDWFEPSIGDDLRAELRDRWSTVAAAHFGAEADRDRRSALEAGKGAD